MNPKALILIDAKSFDLSKALLEYKGIYKRDIQVLDVGKCWSSAGLIVTLGGGR